MPVAADSIGHLGMGCVNRSRGERGGGGGREGSLSGFRPCIYMGEGGGSVQLR